MSDALNLLIRISFALDISVSPEEIETCCKIIQEWLEEVTNDTN